MVFGLRIQNLKEKATQDEDAKGLLYQRLDGLSGWILKSPGDARQRRAAEVPMN